MGQDRRGGFGNPRGSQRSDQPVGQAWGAEHMNLAQDCRDRGLRVVDGDQATGRLDPVGIRGGAL